MSAADRSTNRFDLLVVGGGAFGLGTAAEAAMRGLRVAVVERGPLPNPIAASYGPSRKIRSTYTEPHYAALARKAMQRWREIEAQTGDDLYLAVGNLNFTALDQQPYLDDLEKVSRQIGADIEILGQAELRARFPQFKLAKRALLERDAGFVRASACIESLRIVAERAGATILPEREIVAIDQDGQVVEVRTAGGERFQGERAVLALGGWTKRLLPELTETLTQTKQGIMYLAEVPPIFHSPQMPAWGCSDEGHYGFPAWRTDVFKIAHHVQSEPVASPDFDRRTTPPGFVEGAEAFLRDHFGIDPSSTTVRAESCMYNLSPTSDFLVDFHPRDARLLVATGGSGHGFKFGSVIGAVVMDRLDDVDGDNWSPLFSWDAVVNARALTGRLR
ncbi:MAG: FAD-dependent oxidoreductase [Chloroflexi bacterium]|nr:FAD-dependent oxidoreductase [Chloroflexota bacterium]